MSQLFIITILKENAEISTVFRTTQHFITTPRFRDYLDRNVLSHIELHNNKKYRLTDGDWDAIKQLKHAHTCILPTNPRIAVSLQNKNRVRYITSTSTLEPAIAAQDIEDDDNSEDNDYVDDDLEIEN